MALADYLISRGVTSQTMECLKQEGFKALDDLLMLLEEEGNPLAERISLQQYLRLRQSLRDIQNLCQNSSQSQRIFQNLSFSSYKASPRMGRKTPPLPSLSPRIQRLNRVHEQGRSRRFKSDSANESDSANDNDVFQDSNIYSTQSSRETLQSYSSSPGLDERAAGSSDDSPLRKTHRKRVTFSEQLNYSSDDEAFRHDPWTCANIHASPVLKSLIGSASGLSKDIVDTQVLEETKEDASSPNCHSEDTNSFRTCENQTNDSLSRTRSVTTSLSLDTISECENEECSPGNREKTALTISSGEHTEGRQQMHCDSEEIESTKTDSSKCDDCVSKLENIFTSSKRSLVRPEEINSGRSWKTTDIDFKMDDSFLADPINYPMSSTDLLRIPEQTSSIKQTIESLASNQEKLHSHSMDLAQKQISSTNNAEFENNSVPREDRIELSLIEHEEVNPNKSWNTTTELCQNEYSSPNISFATIVSLTEQTESLEQEDIPTTVTDNMEKRNVERKVDAECIFLSSCEPVVSLETLDVACEQDKTSLFNEENIQLYFTEPAEDLMSSANQVDTIEQAASPTVVTVSLETDDVKFYPQNGAALNEENIIVTTTEPVISWKVGVAQIEENAKSLSHEKSILLSSPESTVSSEEAFSLGSLKTPIIEESLLTNPVSTATGWVEIPVPVNSSNDMAVYGESSSSYHTNKGSFSFGEENSYISSAESPKNVNSSTENGQRKPTMQSRLYSFSCWDLESPRILDEAPLACWDGDSDSSDVHKKTSIQNKNISPSTTSRFGVIKNWINYTFTSFPFQFSKKPSSSRSTDL